MPNRQGLAIRAADPGDADGLAELFASAGLVVPRDRLAARLAALQAQPGVVLLAEVWGPPAGVVALHWTARLTCDHKVAEVGLLLVDPDRRRDGVARLLLKAASQAARSGGCGELVLDTATEGDGLEAFSLATGFSPAGRRLRRSLRKQG